MATAKVWKAELLKISPARLNTLRKEVRCRQVMDVSPPTSLPPGEYVLLGKRSRAVNLDSQFEGAISTPEKAIRMKWSSENLVSEERELTVHGKGPASTNSTVSQLSPELKKRRVEAAESTVDRRFEAFEKRMQTIEADNVGLRADNVDLRDRLKRVEADKLDLGDRLKRVEADKLDLGDRLKRVEADNLDLGDRLEGVGADNMDLRDRLEHVQLRMQLYVSSGVSLRAAACSLVEYAADLISFEQRNLIATELTDVQPQSVKNINAGFRAFWSGPGYIEDVRFNQFLKNSHKKPEETEKASEAVKNVAVAVGVLEKQLDAAMHWYVLGYRISRNVEAHVFGLFKDPAYKKAKPEEKKKGSKGRCEPKTIKELQNRLNKSMQKPEYAGFSGRDLEIKEQMLEDVLDHLEDLPDEFKAHEIVFKALAEHARKELVTLRSQQSGQ